MVRLEKTVKGRTIAKTKTLRFSLRIFSPNYPKGKVTSISLKKSIVILWVIFGTQNFSFEKKKGLHDRIEQLLTDFIYKSLERWDYPDGVGLSEFILECMYEDFLVKKDYRRFKQLMIGL